MAEYQLVPQLRLTILFVFAWAAAAQTSAQPGRFREAGVCSRCHVAQVLEWSTSGHQKADVACQNCHGASTAHVANERNEVKPDRMPRAAAIGALCSSCHSRGCPRTGQRDACESCHHPHALFNPKENNQPESMRFPRDDRLQVFETHMRKGDDLVRAEAWKQARAEFEAALRAYPNHPRTESRLELVRRRLNPKLPGFELVGDKFDAETGLPSRVRVTGFAIEMVLIPRGDVDVGDDKVPGFGPVHTVSVKPFYMATTELTQRVWTAVATDNPSSYRGDDLPVNNVSWNDAQHWIGKLNSRIPGGGFRLPSEPEWEKAAQSQMTQEPLAEVAWFRENSAAHSQASEFRQINAYAPRPVGTRKPNAYGIYDLAGNVWEWCSSLWKAYPYDARDGRESLADEGLRVLRGGGFADPAEYLTSSFRHSERPDRRLLFNGFRLVRTVPPFSE